MIQLQEHHTPRPFSLFNLGFRPFFLGGAVAAVLLIAVWIFIYSYGLQPSYYGSGVYWHAHEMIFGFALAIIAGFLLTAVRNWTHVQTLHGPPLALLFLLWATARIAPLLPGLPAEVMAVIDLTFAPLLIIAVAIPILRSGNYRNLIFVPLLSGFFIGNLLVHLQFLGISEETADYGIHLGIVIIIVIMTIIGGRVIPFFSERGITGISCKRYSLIEKGVIPLSVAWLILNFTTFNLLLTLLSFLLAFINAIRVYGWFSGRIFASPLVWILQLGYTFLPIGYLLFALSLLDIVALSVAYHAFAAGGIGALTLGMMSRVSLGHTGRSLNIRPTVTLAFTFLLSAAVLRIAIHSLPMPYLVTLYISGALWCLAWIIFLVHYTGILIKPRADGIYG